MRKSIFKNYLYNILYQVLIVIAPLVTAPYLARALGAEALGVYSYVSTAGSVISSVGLLGLYNYGVRQIAYSGDNSAETNYIFWEIMLVRLLLLFPSVASFLLLGLISESSFAFLTYLPWLVASYADISWLCVGKENMKPAVVKNACTKIASIIGIFLFVKDENDVWKYLALIALSTLISNLSVWFSVSQYIKKPKIRDNSILQHLTGAVKLFLPQVATIIYVQVDKLMLRWISGSEQIAFYDQADKIIHIPLTFITVLSTVMMPRIANEFKMNNTDKISHLINKAMKFAMLLAMPMMMGICGIANNFIPWYLGTEFLPVITVIYFISPIILFNSFTSVLGGQYLIAVDQTSSLTKSHFSAAVLNVLLNCITIPFFGCAGAAVSTLASSLLSVAIQYNAVKAQIKVKIFSRSFFNCLISSIIMFVVVLLAGEILNIGILSTAIQIVIGAIIYVIMLLITSEKMILETIALIRNKLRCINVKKRL